MLNVQDIESIKNAFVDLLMQDFRYTLEDKAYCEPNKYQAEYDAFIEGYYDLMVSCKLSDKISHIVEKFIDDMGGSVLTRFTESFYGDGFNRIGECLYLHSQGHGSGFFDYVDEHAKVLNQWTNDNWRFISIEVEYDQCNNRLTCLGV